MQADTLRVRGLNLDPAATAATSGSSATGAVMTLQAVDTSVGKAGIFRLQPSTGYWDWQIARDATHPDRTQMNLSSGNELTLYPAASDEFSSLLLTPGVGTPGGGLLPHTFPVITLHNPTKEDDAFTISRDDGSFLFNGLPLLTTSASTLAFGAGSTAVAGSFAFGNGLQLTAAGQLAAGRWNRPDGVVREMVPTSQPLFMVGNGNTTTRSHALAVMGDGSLFVSNNLVIGQGSIADSANAAQVIVAGYANTTTGLCSLNVGSYNTLSSSMGATIGQWNYVGNYGSFAFGGSNYSDGNYSFIAGILGWSRGYVSTAFGLGSAAEGQAAFAAGGSRAEGHYTTALGVGSYANAYGQVAVGRFNKLQGDYTSFSTAGIDDLQNTVTAEDAKGRAPTQIDNVGILGAMTQVEGLKKAEPLVPVQFQVPRLDAQGRMTYPRELVAASA